MEIGKNNFLKPESQLSGHPPKNYAEMSRDVSYIAILLRQGFGERGAS